jgi:hypothetical protein
MVKNKQQLENRLLLWGGFFLTLQQVSHEKGDKRGQIEKF